MSLQASSTSSAASGSTTTAQPGPPHSGQVMNRLPPDSEDLPKGESGAVDEAVRDRRYRRYFRVAVVVTAILVMVTIAGNMTWVVCSITQGFQGAMKQDTIAKAVAVQVVEQVASAAQSASSSSSVSASAAASASSAPAARAKAGHTAATPNKVRVEASIFGEIRDSLIPLVGLVSILTLALVVITVTMLRASFAPDKSLKSNDPVENSDGIVFPVPAIEALKSFIDSVKSIFGK